MVSEAPEEAPVLIIGGGSVGLSASLFLSHHGIKSTVIERHSGTSIHPRGRGVNARTMELFRHIGIVDMVYEAGKTLSDTGGMHQGSSLKAVIEAKRPKTGGKKGMPFSAAFASVGPVAGTWVTQDMMEPVLVNAAKERGGDVRFNTEYIPLTQDEERVTATLRDRTTGTTSTILANYLIAADGAKSPIRTSLNVPVTGAGTLGHLLNILFEADLKSFVAKREFSLCKIRRPEVSGLFTSINNSNLWVFHLAYDPAKSETPADFPPERCRDLLRLALGMPDIEINIRSILPWEPSVRTAEKLQHGRVFLAGDAAKQCPPWGGQGANMGVNDAYNLVWKLAAVLKGRAGKELLNTYEIERIPVNREAAEASGTGVDENGIVLMELSLANIEGWRRRIPLISGHGYGYASKAIAGEDTSPLGGWSWRPWTLPSLGFAIDGRPGRRVPHVWVEKQGKRISTLDLSGKGFVLLAGADGTAWVDAASAVSSNVGFEIAAYCVGSQGDLVASKDEFEIAAGISSTGAILVRPDDFVAWRERRGVSDSQARLEATIKRLLCLA